MFFENQIFIIFSDCRKKFSFHNSFDSVIANLDSKLNSFNLTSKEKSLILPLIFISNSLNPNEKLKQLNVYYKTALNCELCFNQRDFSIYFGIEQVKLFLL